MLISSACVPPKYFAETEKERDDCKNEREKLVAENEKLTVDNTELKAKLDQNAAEIDRIEKGGLANAEELKNLKSRYAELNQQYNDLQKAHQSLISGSDTETRELMTKLDNTQKGLNQREDKLNQLSVKLDNERDQLNQVRQQLDQRNAKLVELQGILDKKNKALTDLKKKITDALLGFENQGLSITQKNGKVYVSMEEKLLFGSGSTQVDPQGKVALKKLASVLEQNPDINITIEGHTDDVPVIPGSKYTDNWDLSVLRATSIIRILLDGTTIDPKRLTAAGRGQYQPVDTAKTPEARQKNRRTDIILTPNLDELFQILDQSK